MDPIRRRSLIRYALAYVGVWLTACPEAAVDPRVEARIVRLEKVTAESRQAYRMLAGRARLTADVVLIDVTTGAVVARFTAEGQSSVMATTEQAIRRASEQIMAFVVAHLNS